MNKTYYTAVYLRLSKEDSDLSLHDNKKESNSITNQKLIIKEFLKAMPEVEIYDYYIDDGYSGSNFERPDFKRMREDIYEGKVNMVIVKDFSRFGREYIDTGRYIQKIFPRLGIRFISVIDHFDSDAATANDMHLLVPVKNFVNDNYCRDISQRVRTHQEAMRKNGLYIGAYVAYGYKKDSDDKNTIVIDEQAADIVKKIFTWRLSGMNVYSIVRKLNELGIPSPMAYKRMQGINFKTGFSEGNQTMWCDSTVYGILKNKIYVGVLEQGKKSRISYKVKKTVNKPREEWAVIEDNHNAIISKSDFKKVEQLSKRDTKRSKEEKNVYLFSGMLFCKDCKKQMTRRCTKYKGKQYVSYICSTYNKQQGCTRHGIKEEQITEIVLKALQEQVELVGKLKNMLDIAVFTKDHTNELANSVKVDLITYDMRIKEKKDEHSQCSGMISSLYDDLQEGIIKEEEYVNYRRIYEEKLRLLDSQIISIAKEMDMLMENKKKSRDWIRQVCDLGNLTELNRLILVSLVDRIYCGEDNQILIKLGYQDKLFLEEVI
ncbi:MAG: recombinase family protein [Clostridiales bacterium]|nr:recombinase family protein [Clostridiales bacterium]